MGGYSACIFVTNLPCLSLVAVALSNLFNLFFFFFFFYQRAMDIVGFSQDEKQSLYTLLSAILNIGNVTFEAVFDKSSGHNIHDSVDLKNEKCKLSRNCVPIK